MTSGARPIDRPTHQSDADLLRAIREDMQTIYKDILQRPLPRNISAVLSRFDEEESEEKHRERRLGTH
jgi:hypothetical protein